MSPEAIAERLEGLRRLYLLGTSLASARSLGRLDAHRAGGSLVGAPDTTEAPEAQALEARRRRIAGSAPGRDPAG
ncbi:MAG: hypothetical protein HY909_29650 [Deltaproteobacteria bacterium]|nr:hypothetical protein [Deltaproteobacteria bacterium]